MSINAPPPPSQLPLNLPRTAVLEGELLMVRVRVRVTVRVAVGVRLVDAVLDGLRLSDGELVPERDAVTPSVGDAVSYGVSVGSGVDDGAGGHHFQLTRTDVPGATSK
jgi:hypothetical protein